MNTDTVITFLRGIGPSEWLAFGSAVAAVWSFVLNRQTVKRQEIMQVESLRAARDNSLIAWADDVIETLSNAQKLCRDHRDSLIDETAFLTRRSEMRARLSALLDRGRLFFPNARVEENPDKPAAFQGKRQKALDAIFGAYRTISDIGRDGGPDQTAALMAVIEHRRAFVSEVFLHVDPRRRRDVISALER